jgi:hypothetical protein
MRAGHLARRGVTDRLPDILAREGRAAISDLKHMTDYIITYRCRRGQTTLEVFDVFYPQYAIARFAEHNQMHGPMWGAGNGTGLDAIVSVTEGMCFEED